MEIEAPELAALAHGFFDARVHKTLATLRRDGYPRISGTEADFAEGELRLGSIWQSLKALDLRHDPRFALHSGSADPPGWRGDAKVAGSVEEITEPGQIAHKRRGRATRSLSPLPRRHRRARRRTPRGPARSHRHRIVAHRTGHSTQRAPMAADATAAAGSRLRARSLLRLPL